MTSKGRVLCACEFRRPDRIPRFDKFWQFTDEWRNRFGDEAGLTDIEIWAPSETPFPGRAHVPRTIRCLWHIVQGGRDGAGRDFLLPLGRPPGAQGLRGAGGRGGRALGMRKL